MNAISVMKFVPWVASLYPQKDVHFVLSVKAARVVCYPAPAMEPETRFLISPLLLLVT
jgi:hypothetical protein